MTTSSTTSLAGPLIPGEFDSAATWNYLQAGLDRIMADPREGIDMKTYMGLYSAVHSFCTAQKVVESGGCNGSVDDRGAQASSEEKLYKHIVEYLTRYLENVYEESIRYADDALFAEERKRYFAAAKINDYIFRYLSRHWVKRQMDEGMKNIYAVYRLHVVLWGELVEDRRSRRGL